jgi:hypothetical protein
VDQHHSRPGARSAGVGQVEVDHAATLRLHRVDRNDERFQIPGTLHVGQRMQSSPANANASGTGRHPDAQHSLMPLTVRRAQ